MPTCTRAYPTARICRPNCTLPISYYSMKKHDVFPRRKHGDFLADPILCSTYMVQKAIEAIAQNRMRLSTQTGVLQFLLSDRNRTRGMFDALAIEAKLNNEEGKKVLVRRKFRPIRTNKEITGQPRNYCAPAGSCATPPKEDVINLGFDYSEQLMCFSESELRLAGMGETISASVAEEFSRALVAHENTFAAVVVKRILSGGLVGTFKGGDAIKDLPLYLANGKALNPVAMVYMNQWLSEVGVNDSPALIGGSLVQAFNAIRTFASPHQEGFNPALGEGIETIVDYSVPNVLGDADHAILVAPGALQLFTYNLHKGEFIRNENDPNTRRYRLVSPFTGIEWDAFWVRARNCDTGDWEWTITLSLIWDVVGLPACWSDDDCMDGVLDVWKVNIVCEDSGVCDIDRGTSCIDASALPLAVDTIVFPAASVLCAQPCRLILNTTEILNARRHALSTTSTDAAIGLQFGGTTLNFATPITLGDLAGSTALKAAVQAAIGSAGVVVSGTFSTPNTTIAIITDGTIAGVELIIDDAANLEFTTTTIAKACRVTSTLRPSTGATSTSLRVVHGGIDVTGAPTDAFTQTDSEGIFSDFFVTGETPFTFGDTITVTYTDSAACTDTEVAALCSAD